ncbi:hypothetical protein SEA_SLOOPYJOE_54 [Arthrobacter phage Sloopyjoe]|nr:hypothetical protein PBI_SHIBA_53 [Arthrobacter phage Shiba]QFG10198.1 hypothetical protein PBI_EGAD_54 [Arthrobacter phage Egad]QFG11768.1 hypothetical protein PBI_SALK_54 [Arthrobacter phage Salk]QFG14423.1 hypothetical protein PBI_STARLORD_54 [Arthrobacter phage StarLord]UVT31132.1 hypothetical protein PBI_LINDA_54 [Arthrobacter phage Linda]WAB09470.1 hypothetical protein SEA_SLOOPYJOE_54 [Arthrobacter phage Sloopyjoe]
MTERGQAVVLVVGGMLIGAGVTTLVLKKHYQKIADEEIASVKATYKKHYDDLAGKGDIQDIEDGSPWVTSPTVPPVVAPHEPTAYNKVQTSEERKAEARKLADGLGYSSQTREEPSDVNITKVTVQVENDAIDPTLPERTYVADTSVPSIPIIDDSVDWDPSPAEEEVLNAIIDDEEKDPKVPYVISVDDYMEGVDGWESHTLTYYEKDQQLCDDKDQLIPDVRQTVGFGNLQKFGKMSGNGDTVYIRNHQRQADYEVVRDPGSYREEVLNITTWDEDERIPKVKKFRDGN